MTSNFIDLIPWFLEGDSLLRHRTMMELEHRERDDPEVKKNLIQLRNDVRYRNIINDVREWPWPALSNHKSSDHPHHKFVFLSEIGLSIEELGIEKTINGLMISRDDNGIFRIPIKIGPGYGGSGNETLAWMLCDAPLITTALVRFGFADDKEVKRSIDRLIGIVRNNGWPCTSSPSIGKFRGPGRKDDPCPYANMIMLKLMAELPEYRDCPAARQGVESALTLWEESRVNRPYQFGTGRNFRKLKLPLVWYDIVHLADILTRFPAIQKDDRMREIISVIQTKCQNDRYTPESVYTPWKDWDFGQKKEPSRWMTFQVNMIIKRHQESATI